MVGYLSGTSPDDSIEILADFRRGLAETGYVEGRNLAIEYRWLEGRYDRIPTMLGDLVERRVAVIAVPNTTTAALAAKAATRTIPIVFAVGSDPVAIGLVVSLNRPEGNLTGVSMQQTTAAAHRLELLHELKPAERSIAFLVNPTNPSFAAAETREVQSAANVLGVDLVVLNASSTSEIEAAFLTLVQRHAGALLIGGDIFFVSRTDQLVALAARHAVPAMYTYIEQRWPAVLSPTVRTLPKLSALLAHGTESSVVNDPIRRGLRFRCKRILRAHSQRGEARQPSGPTA